MHQGMGTTHAKSKPPLKVYTVDGSEHKHGEVNKFIQLPTQIGEWTGKLKLLVTDLHDSSILLGADWLIDANPTIDWKQHQLTFPKPFIKLIKENNPLVPSHYQEYWDVFSEKEATRLPKRKKWDMPIDLEIPPEEFEKKIGKGRIYAMTQDERKELDEWVKDQLNKGYIRPSRSPIAAPVFFIPKKEGTKRLVQNYKRLNQYVTKDSYPIPIMKTLAERVEGSKIFTALDLRWGYHNVRIREGDEWKAAFSTPMGLYEPTVMLFGMSNSPATFQRMMDDILRGLEHCTLVYLDDILIFSRNPEEHVQHVQEVLQRLRENDLFAKPEKCVFETDTLEYLGTWIEKGHLRMDKGKVESIVNWPTPKKVKDIRSFLGFANFYRHFIKDFHIHSRPLTKLTKKGQSWIWEADQQRAFDQLKDAFTKAPILLLPDDDKPFVLETDASDFAIGAVLSQQGPDGKMHPVGYYSTRMDEAERNYEIFDKEMLAVIKSLKRWRHHLQGSQHPVKVYSDHQNIKYFKNPQDLSPRQARWYAKLLHYNLEFIHQPAAKSARSDALSRNPEWKPLERDNQGVTLLKPHWDGSPTIKQISHDPLLRSIVKATDYDSEVIQALHILKQHDNGNLKQALQDWTIHEGLILYQGQVYVPKDLEIKRKILERHHDAPWAGHPGREKTLDLVSRNYWWPSMTQFIHQYVDECLECQRNKILPRKPQHLMGRHEIPDQPWECISVDFITDLPESQNHTALLTVIDYHSKQGHFIPTTKDASSETLFQLYLHNVWKLHGTPRKIVSDRGPQFASEFTKAIQQGLGIETALSTAHRPQTDGQTERLNQTVETFLRIFTSYHQNDWVSLLPYAEFAYNNQKHSSTGWSPFFINHGKDPHFEINYNPINKVPEARNRLQMMKELWEEVNITLQRTQNQMAKQLNGPEYKPYRIGDKVWLENTNLTTTAPTKKLDAKRSGPYTIIGLAGPHAYKLKLPPGMSQLHPTFHESLLRPFKTDNIKGRTQEPPPPLELLEGGDRYEVETILNSRKRGKGVQYLVKWKGYSHNENTWEPSRNIDDAKDLITQYHTQFPHKPRAFIKQSRTIVPRREVMSRAKTWQDKISHICQEIRDIKNYTRKQFSINSIEGQLLQKTDNYFSYQHNRNTETKGTDEGDGLHGTDSSYNTVGAMTRGCNSGNPARRDSPLSDASLTPLPTAASPPMSHESPLSPRSPLSRTSSTSEPAMACNVDLNQSASFETLDWNGSGPLIEAGESMVGESNHEEWRDSREGQEEGRPPDPNPPEGPSVSSEGPGPPRPSDPKSTKAVTSL
jgi:hypothetical protein